MLIKEWLSAFKPSNIAALSKHSFRDSTKFFSKFLMLAFVVMGIIYIPTLVSLPSYFGQQMLKFNSLSINSNFSVMAPVYFPERDSLVVVDTTGMHKSLKHERFLVTKEGLKYKFLGTEYFMKGNDFNDVLANKSNFSILLSAIALIVLPSFIFWTYVLAWIKYFVTILLLASIFFTLFDLTHFRKKWRCMFNLTVYAATIPILIEAVSAPLSTDYLLPIIKLAGIDVYAVTLIIHASIIVALTFVLHYAGGSRESDS